MNAIDLINQLATDGLSLTVTKSNRLRVTGDLDQVDRYRPVIGQYHHALINAIKSCPPAAPGKVTHAAHSEGTAQ